MARHLVSLMASMILFLPAQGAEAPRNGPDGAVLALDLSVPDSRVHLVNGPRRTELGLEFDAPNQHAEIPFQKALDGIEALSVGGWFFPYRSGEQSWFSRGLPRITPRGERFFRREDDRVHFVLGTDQHGFFLGTVNGNGSMPFPLVSLNAVPERSWSHLVVVKDAQAHHSFYINGTLVHSDREATAAGVVHPFRDTAKGEPLRLRMPLGGRIGAVWVVPRALSTAEVRRDFEAGRDRYTPNLPAEPVALRPMDAHFDPTSWGRRGGAPTAANWPEHRARILRGVMDVLGPFPDAVVPLEPRSHGEVDCGRYVRRKVSIQVQPRDRMHAYLLIPKRRHGRVPAVICFYGTTAGAGKDTTVGLSGARPGSPPRRNMAFALDVIEAGMIALAPDYLRDGERLPPSGRPYDTTDFYREFPRWSIHGKDVWDTMRAVDYLQTLDIVDPERIGMTGHSCGGHSTIFAAALEPRIKVAVANGPVSDFRGHGLHWAVDRGGGSSQSLPAMRRYVLDPTLTIPVEFYEWTSLIAPRPLWVGQAVGELRPREEENHGAVRQVYEALGAADRVRYSWYPGDHDFPPAAREAAMAWFARGFGSPGAGGGEPIRPGGAAR